jgi:hypothetical protein
VVVLVPSTEGAGFVPSAPTDAAVVANDTDYDEEEDPDEDIQGLIVGHVRTTLLQMPDVQQEQEHFSVTFREILSSVISSTAPQ